MFEALPAQVSVYEVGLRDGLQNEPVTVSVDGKVQLAEALISAGLRRIEAGSFVSPKWVPQLADSDQLLPWLPRLEGVSYGALVPNLNGLARAVAAGAKEVAVFVSANEEHSQKNLNKPIDDALAEARDVAAEARHERLRVRGYLSMVWGAPTDFAAAATPIDRVHDLVGALLEMGCYEVSLGDTVGLGTPKQTEGILESLLLSFPAPALAVHLHDTRGTALANALVALELGVETFDSSVGGLGGCPYAPVASGNLATEDLVYLLHGMGVRTGIDLDRLVGAGEIAQRLVGHPLVGRVFQATLGARERTKQKQARHG